MVLKSTLLQSFVLDRHERAFRELLPRLPEIRRIAIVGGGIFPRSAIILGKLLPQANITIIDASAANIRIARTFLDGHFEFVHRIYDGSAGSEVDLIVLPLSFIGDRQEFYDRPTARAMLVHDWIWRRRGPSRIVSWPLLKRLNLVLG
jgi:hypothetical protein